MLRDDSNAITIELETSKAGSKIPCPYASLGVDPARYPGSTTAVVGAV
jgi:hypothetical protein